MKWSLIHYFILLLLRLAACSFYFPFILSCKMISKVLNNPRLLQIVCIFQFSGYLLVCSSILSWTCSILSGAVTELRNSICLWMTCDVALWYRWSMLAIYCTYILCNPRRNTANSCTVPLKRICLELFEDLSCSTQNSGVHSEPAVLLDLQNLLYPFQKT